MVSEHCPHCGNPIEIALAIVPQPRRRVRYRKDSAAARQERLINENLAIERTLEHIVNQLSSLRESTIDRGRNEGIKSAIRIVRMQLEASRLPKLEAQRHG